MSNNQVEYGIRINVDGDRAAATAIDQVAASTDQLGATAERTGQTLGAVNGQMNDTAAIMRKNAEASSAASEAAQKFLAPLQRQIDLFGASRSEMERYNASQAGLSATTQRQAAALGATIDAMQRDEQEARNFAAEQDRATRAADAFLKKLNEQVATLGMNAQQLQTYRAAQLGVSDAAAPMISKLAETGAGASTAGKHMEGLNFQTVGARRELLVLAHELSQGNFQKFGGSMMVLGEQTGAAGLLFSAAGLAALGLVATLGGLAYAAIKGGLEQKHMNDALVMTGNYAGLTSDSLDALAHSAVNAGGSIGEAKKVAIELAGSGKFTGDQIGYITEATVAWEHATGQSVKSIIKDFESLAVQTTGNSMRATEAISRATLKLDDQYHFLTEAVYEQIRALEKEGDAKGASSLATETFAKVMHDRSEEILHNLGSIARGWNTVKETIGQAVDALGAFGQRSTPAIDVKKYSLKLQRFDEGLVGSNQRLGRPDYEMGEGTAEARKKIVLELTDAVDKLNKADAAGIAQGKTKVAESEASHAASRIAADDVKLQKKGLTELQVALRQYADDVAKIKSVNPDSVLVTDEAVAKHIAAVTKAHQATVKGNDDRAKTLQDGLLQEQTALEREKSIYDARDKMLSLYHSKFGTSDAEFYSGRQAARAEYIASEAIAFAKEASLVQGYKPKNAEEIAANKAKYDQLLKQHLKFVDDMRNAGGEDAAAAAASAKKSYDDIVKATHDAGVADIKRLDDAIAKQKAHNAEIGKSKAGIDEAKQSATELATVQMESDANFIRDAIEKAGFDEAAKAVYTIRLADLDEEIKRRKELAALLGSAAVLDANAKVAADATKAWKRTADTIETDLTNAILDGGGKGWKKLVRDMEVGFAKMVLSPILKPISGGIASYLNPLADQAQAGTGSIGSSLLSTIGTAGSAISAAGTLFGSTAVSAFGSGLSASVMAGSGDAAMLAYATATGNLSAGAAAGASVGSAASGLVSGASSVLAAIPVWGWAALGAVAVGAYLLNDGPESNTRLGFTSNNTAGNISINERGNEGKSSTYIDPGVSSSFGTFGVNSSFWMSSSSPTVTSFLSTVAQTDDALASFLTATEKATVSSYLTGKVSVANMGAEGTDPNANGALDGVFRERINNILTGVEPGLASLVSGFAGTSQALATEAAALLKYRAALRDSGETVFGAKVTLQELAALKTPTEATSAALIRITGEFNATNQVVDLLGRTSTQAFGASGLASEAARAQLIQLSGGVAAMSAQAASFAQNYFTDAERLIPVSKSLDAALAGLGLQTIPTSRKEFRALIDTLTSTGAIATETGAKQFAGLMALEAAFAQVHPLIEETTDALHSAADILSERNDLQKQYDELTMTSRQLQEKDRQALDASNRGLFDQIQLAKKAKDAQEAAKTSLGSVISNMKSFADSTKALSSSLVTGSLSTLTPMQQYAETKRQYDQTLAAARSGDSAAQGQYSAMADAFLTASRTVNSSDAQYSADFASVLQTTDDLAQWASGQVDVAQASLDALNSQVTGIADLNATMLSIAQGVADLPVAFGGSLLAFDTSRYAAGSGAGMDVLVTEVKALRASNEALQVELKGLRADQQRQTGDMMTRTDLAADKAADKIVAGTKEAATEGRYVAANPNRRRPSE